MSENTRGELAHLQSNGVNLKSSALEEQISELESELQRIEAMVEVFAAKIRTRFANEIIEEQELSLLYREIQRQKKEKRRATRAKQKGVQPGLKHTKHSLKEEGATANSSAVQNEEDRRSECKRLYREAMLKVHPDRFAQEEELEERAAEMTRELIDIYASNDLEKLRKYHNYVVSGQAMNAPTAADNHAKPNISLAYLQNRKNELEKQIKERKSEQLYIVLTTYSDPMSFLEEVQAFFDDRLAKLRKRTRKVRRQQA